jgi:hypothetical protein
MSFQACAEDNMTRDQTLPAAMTPASAKNGQPVSALTQRPAEGAGLPLLGFAAADMPNSHSRSVWAQE